MTTTTRTRNAARIVCYSGYTQPAKNAEAAHRRIREVEATKGGCQDLHRVEVWLDGEWVVDYVAEARHILSLDCAQTHNGLTVTHLTWSREAGERADAAARREDGSRDIEAWKAALGTPESVTLTSDGRGAITEGWCRCMMRDTWVQYERWTALGRVAHGFVCRLCRYITQTG